MFDRQLAIGINWRAMLARCSLLVALSLAVGTQRAGAQTCGSSADADIVIMIDVTSSIDEPELDEERLGAKTLLNFFRSAAIPPRVAIGTFYGPFFNEYLDRARIIAPLTDNYGDDDGPGDDDLYARLDGITTNPNGVLTDLAATLLVAQDDAGGLAGADPGSPNYIVMISDGTPTHPPVGCGECGCPAADQAAIDAANAVKAAGTEVFAIHVGTNGLCPGEPQVGLAFLRDQIASGPQFFFEGTGDLEGVFQEIAIQLGCDDGNPCTHDSCEPNLEAGLAAGACIHVPVDCSMFDGACMLGVCNSSTGHCEPQPAHDGLDCDDGAACTDDICSNGTCVSTPRDCTHLDDACQTGFCNPVSGDCDAMDRDADPDCNLNGVQDDCDLLAGTGSDCNSNGLPDDCDIAGGTADDCDTNGVPDSCELAAGDCDNNGVLDACELSSRDCNANDILDDCDITSGTSDDCNGNTVPDACDIAGVTSADCDGNQVPDECDIASGAPDCDTNGIPDTCELDTNDCDSNGVPDDCDIAGGTAPDCNANGRPDACDVAGGTDDCNNNGVPDSCDLIDGDCDSNGVPDDCDLAAGTAPDCNGNDRPDGCDLAGGTATDCDANSVPDSCELAAGDCDNNGVLDACELSSRDCNANDILDDCDITSGTSDDCNGNTVPDACDIAGVTSADCDGNQVPDECDIASGAPDCDTNGIPDTCELDTNDCDSNGVPDDCDIAGGSAPDCNANGQPDACDVAGGTDDCNNNGVPDSCELIDGDCDSNGVPDDCDLAAGTAPDCDGNATPDICDIAGGADDCNTNGIPDTCELDTNDCDINGVPDDCDIAGGSAPDCNANGQPDACDVAGGTDDCNNNGVPDSCELVDGDCDSNGVPDDCDLAAGTAPDCDGNATPDICDIAGGADDCNTNGIPDTCELDTNDCDINGVPDDCDIAGGSAPDCNANGQPDACDVAGGTDDCNNNGVPDSCELVDGDCDSNGVPDDCDLAAGTAPDCDGNDLPDGCDLAGGTATDCDANGVPDSCEIAGQDCDANGILDRCDLAAGTSADCDGNQTPDVCDVAGGRDCNTNGIVDACDLAGGGSQDLNGNNVPDECDPPERGHPGWNFADLEIRLTPDQPAYWSAIEGDSLSNSGLSFAVLDSGPPPGRPANDGTADRVLRGYVLAFAVDADGEEIRWNHLFGEATIVNYAEGSAWRYHAHTYAALAENVAHGGKTGSPGWINLDGIEFQNPHNQLVFNFFADGARPFDNVGANMPFPIDLRTWLTLMPARADLRNVDDNGALPLPVATQASFVIHNENENKKTNTRRCLTCWDQHLLADYGTPNWFALEALGTDMGKAAVNGRRAVPCDIDVDPHDGKMLGEDPRDILSEDTPLLGTLLQELDFGLGGADRAGHTLRGRGSEAGLFRYSTNPGVSDEAPNDAGSENPNPGDTIDLAGGVDSLASPNDGLAAVDRLPAEFAPETRTALPPAVDPRGSLVAKGSVLVFPDVNLRWDGAGNVLQDVFITLTNDYNLSPDVRVKIYFVNGDAPVTP